MRRAAAALRRLPGRQANLVGLAAASVLALGGCGGASAASSASGGSSAGSGTSPLAQVAIKNFTFVPGGLTVAKGTTITWTNDDDSIHTVTADDKRFGSGQLKKGARFSFTPTKSGDISYHCDIHQYMTGTVHVR